MLSLSLATLKELKDFTGPLALFAFAEGGLAGVTALPAATRKAVLEQAKDEGFTGKQGETVSFRLADGRRYIVTGLGKRKDFAGETLRRSAGKLYQTASRFASIWVIPFDDPAAAAEGLLLASHTFTKYADKAKEHKLKEVRFLVQGAADRRRIEKGLAKASRHAAAVTYARDLVNTAPSDKSPESIAKLAKELTGSGITLQVIDQAEARRLGMGSFLGVGRGSAKPSCMLHLKYKPKSGPIKKRIALVGKGVLFDSGGLSLKPPQSLETMKSDMAGAAAVLGVFKVLAALQVRAEVHGITPLTYNMPGCDAMKPGDVLKAMNGKTIEVLNTDAEGRLILADALAYAAKQKFDLMIDLATLTGAAVVALGGSVTAAMTNSKAALTRLQAAAKRSGEQIWELPLVKDYQAHLKSKVADIQNIGSVRGAAGTITAGLFLEEFVDERPWIHLDIAGPAWTGDGTDYCPPGGTGAMVRTLLDYLEAL